MKFNLSSINGQSIKKGINYLKYNGFSGIWNMVRYRMSGPGLAYNGWFKEKHEADEEMLVSQRNTTLPYEPLISIIVPVYLTPEFFLRAMIESVQAQTYAKWELILVDGSRAVDEKHVGDKEESSVLDVVYSIETEKIIRQYMDEDSRIKYRLMSVNQGISGNINEGIKLSAGDYIAVLNHDDVLTEDALFCIAAALSDTRYDCLYSDEDKMSEDGTKYSDPFFKPDFSIDLLRARNYISHFFVSSRGLTRSVGGFHGEYDGAQDYDFILRCCEGEPDGEVLVGHIPRILYHTRMNNRKNGYEHKKEYAREVGKRALSAHLKRKSCYATALHTDLGAIYKVTYETFGNPLLSIIVPGGNNAEYMQRCLEPLFDKLRYSSFEIIVVDGFTASMQEGAGQLLKYYRKLEGIRRNVRVIPYRGRQELPAIRNFGASKAKGDYLLFLDNNTELIAPSSVGDMLGICMRKEVGAVGSAMYFENNTVCHQGIVIGLNGIATYIFQGLKRGALGYMMYNMTNFDYSAVSAACMMVKKENFDNIGGFSEKFTGELSDLDFCLRIRELNKLVVCSVDASWYYYKPSMSFMLSDPQESARKEEELFKLLWSDIFDRGDPYYNPNFSLTEPFELRE